MPAGEHVTLTVRLVPAQTDGTDPTTQPTTEPGSGGGSATPGTGDSSCLGLWLSLLVLSAMGLAVLAVKRNFWKRLLSLVLCAAMLATMIPAIPLGAEAAEADPKTIHISTTVQVGGQPLTVNATVKYVLAGAGETQTHTVQFDLDYEGAPQIESQQVVSGQCAAAPDGVAREGYVFGYWYVREFDGIHMFDLSRPVTQDLTLYAYWIKEGSGSDVNFSTFYKVSFAYPDSMTEEDRIAVYLPEERLVYENALVYSLDEPIMEGYVFAAWYYDSAMTQMAGAEDVITKDTVLYPLMLEDAANTDGMPTNNYVAAQDVTDMTYAVTVKAPSAQAVKDGLIWLDIAKGGQLLDYTVNDNGNGTYTLQTVEPLQPGKTYQLRVQDREKMPATGLLVNALDSYIRFYHNGELQSIDVEYYNIFTAAQEVNNLKLSNGLVLIPIDQVTGIDLEAAVSLISLSPDANGEMGMSQNAQTGSFQYTGHKVLQPGDVIFIYEGDPAAVEEEYATLGTVGAATNSTFVKLASVEGDTYYYGTPELNEVLFMPDVLPIHLAEDKDGNAEDNTITVADSCLDFSILPLESAALNANTVAEPGDFIAFYDGTLDAPTNIRYAKILTVQRAEGFTTITFEEATVEDIQTSIDSYVRTPVDVELTELQQVDCGTRLAGYALKPQTIELPPITYSGRLEARTDVPYTLDYITYSPGGYLITIYYDVEYYKVVFDEDVQYFHRTQEATFPTAEKEGYKLAGWKSRYIGDTNLYQPGDTYKVMSTPTYFYPVFTEADDVKYTVKHYLEQEDGTYPQEPNETEEFFDGTTGSFVSPAVKSYTGFKSPLQKSVQVEADGSTVVEYYYARKSYDIRVDFAIAGENLTLRGSYTSSYKYGVPFSFTDAQDAPLYIDRPGYRIAGWYLADETLNPDQTLLDSEYYWVDGAALTCDQELVFKPKWEKLPMEYQVEHYTEQLDGSYTLHRTDKLTAYIHDNVTAQASQFTGFTYDASNSGNVPSGTITVGSTLVLKLYYTRNSYEAKWYDYNGTTLLGTTQFQYGQTVTASTFTANREGYTFGGWSIGTTTMPLDGLSFNAKDHGTWTANTYTVRFHANGGSGTMAQQQFTYDKQQALRANAFTMDGYTFAGWSLTANGEARYADQEQVTNLASSGTVTLYAQWEAGTATAYKVVYYGETLDGTGYAAVKTENHTGVTNTTVSATAINIPGFTYQSSNGNNVTSGVIAADGTLVLKLYYTRNSYTLTLDFDGENLKQALRNPDTYVMEITAFDVADQTFTFKYGQTLTLPDIQVSVWREGGWQWDEALQEDVYIEPGYENVAFGQAFPGYIFDSWDGICDTMPAEDLTLTAQWTPMDVTVKLSPGVNYAGSGEAVPGDTIVIDAKYGDIIDLTPYEYSYDGYFMAGWNYDTTITAGAEITGELVLLDGYYSYNMGFSVSQGMEHLGIPVGEMPITAFWVSEHYKRTILFDSNDGSGSVVTQLLSDSGTWTALLNEPFVRDGYRFIGWSEQPQYDPESEFLYENRALLGWYWYDLTEKTLYAQWEKIEEQ